MKLMCEMSLHPSLRNQSIDARKRTLSERLNAAIKLLDPGFVDKRYLDDLLRDIDENLDPSYVLCWRGPGNKTLVTYTRGQCQCMYSQPFGDQTSNLKIYNIHEKKLKPAKRLLSAINILSRECLPLNTQY